MNMAEDRDLHRSEMAALEALFAEARSGADTGLSQDLFAAIMADAHHIQQEQRAPAPIAAARPARQEGDFARGGLVGLLNGAFGGWLSLGGLAAASCAGLWIGLAAPEVLTRMTGIGASVQAAVDVPLSEDMDAYQSFDMAALLAEEMQ